MPDDWPTFANGKRVPKSKGTGGPCPNCKQKGSPCRHHGGKSTGPKTTRGKKAARLNSTTHGMRSDPLIFLDSMPTDKRAAFDALVTELSESEQVNAPADLIIVRDLVLADLLAQRGLEYVLNEWTTAYKDDGRAELAQREALSQWQGLSRLKASLRAALRTGTGARGDPSKVSGIVTLEDLRAARREMGDRAAQAPSAPSTDDEEGAT